MSKYSFSALVFLLLALSGCGDKGTTTSNAEIGNTVEAGKPIPRSASGDKGKYYLLESSREGNIVKTLHKRVGIDTLGFTRAEIDCSAMKIKEIGYGEGSVDNIKTSPTDWFDLVPGSSKSDLAVFVCN